MDFKAKFYSQHKSLSFNDVLIQPTSKSDIKSRLDTDVSSYLTKNYLIDVPILASPMDRVVNFSVVTEMASLGSAACTHRFKSIEEHVREMQNLFTYRDVNSKDFPLIAAVSAQDSSEEQKRINLLSELSDIFIIDTAMGTNSKVLKTIEKIKKDYPRIDVIAGNVVNPEGAKSLIDSGVDAIRLGVGNGSVCATRLQTGCGRGQLTVLIECKDICRRHNVRMISDGGVTTPGDFAKAIAAGADIVMMGSPLAGHIESPGEILYKYEDHFFPADKDIYIPGLGLRRACDIDGLKQYKQYRGMASKELQQDWRGGVKPGTTHEGVQNYLRIKGSLRDTVNNFIGGLRSAMSYCDSKTIDDFYKNAKFEKLSIGSQRESYDRPSYYK